ncbi:MAG: BatD family protein [Bacteroidales bacterium]
MKRKLILFFLLVVPGLLLAQNISFSGQAPRQVYLGQQFQLTYTINAEGSNFMSPEITNFDILAGPMLSSGQQVMNVNGKIEYSSSMSFTFILQGTKAGTFTISQAVITVKGKRYMSNPVTITVLNQSQRSAPPAQNNIQQEKEQVPANDNIGNNIFLKAVVDKNNPYQGEQTVTFKLYTPTNRLQIDAPEKIPSYPGFWAQDLLKDATSFRNIPKPLTVNATPLPKSGKQRFSRKNRACSPLINWCRM